MKVISPKRLMQSVFPTVRNGSIFNASSLDLQFARTKTLDPRVTFTRASSGTYVGSDGLIKSAAVNEARFDHNPTTLESLGLLVEAAGTNLVTYSEQFDNAAWTQNAGTKAITANTVVAPDGTTTADTVTVTEYTELGSPGSVSGIKTFSVFLKAGTISTVTLRLYSSAAPFEVTADFNLSTGAATVTNGASVAIASAQRLPNGWYRCALTRTDAASNHNGTIRYSGTGNFYIWGAQLEAGSFPTSYIPTVASTVTRSADVASITGTNYSSFVNVNEGTWFSIAPRLVGNGGRVFDSRSAILFAGVNATGYSYTSTTAQQINTTYPIKGAVVYSSTDVYGAANGTLNTGNTGGRAVNHTYIDIGSANTAAAGVGFLNAPIARLTYWPTRLPNATLQQITQ